MRVPVSRYFEDAGCVEVVFDQITHAFGFPVFEGTIWYKKSFAYALAPGRRLFVHFGGANYETIAYLNGEKLGRHIGGFTPFASEITDQLTSGENDLIVKVDNKRLREGVPTLNTDWWNYGGLTRDVELINVPANFVSEYYLGLSDDADSIVGWVRVAGDDPTQTIEVRIPELNISTTITTDTDGFGRFESDANPIRWSS